MQSVRIYEMPACRMVSSGAGMFGEGNFAIFEEWFSSQPRGLFPKDFLYWAGEGFIWLYQYEAGQTVPPELETIEFPGGLYAVGTDMDQNTDKDKLNEEIDRFLRENGLERDQTRAELGNVITSDRAREILGYEQMDYYIPVRAKETKN